ncbi:MAG TPA: hypothetical protein VNL17_14685 [Verrucomicrobiae bacterium]|nr:hypothetical protein [Verrucomicrobiae bacterium]
MIWKDMWDSVYDSRSRGFHAPDPPQQFYWVANEPLLRQIAGMIGGIPGVDPFIDIPAPPIPPPAVAHPSILVTTEPSLIPGSFLAQGDSPSVPEGARAPDASGRIYQKKVFLHTPWTTIAGWIPIA